LTFLNGAAPAGDVIGLTQVRQSGQPSPRIVVVAKDAAVTEQALLEHGKKYLTAYKATTGRSARSAHRRAPSP
jgi:hypothetical protein